MAVDVKIDENIDVDDLRFYSPPSLHEEAPFVKNMFYKYIKSEFPCSSENSVHSIPKYFRKNGERQACEAEKLVFQRLKNLSSIDVSSDLSIIFFHSASYAGYSNRNQRLGKLMIREHDFVVFVKCEDKHYVLLIEVKSTNDRSTFKENIEITADAKIIKNNKRSAQHQLRDHLEVLQNGLGHAVSSQIQTYIVWPYLGAKTRDPKHKVIDRWSEDKDLHVFEDAVSKQSDFNRWFIKTVLKGRVCGDATFGQLLKRYIILSCGVFMDEIDSKMLALLTQQQLELLRTDLCKKRGSLVVHGIAGTGKTLLILKKLQLLHENNELNDANRALYICYWPGIRCDVINKLKTMGIDRYVDTTRFFITAEDFLKNNKIKYKHIFMDEAEATILSFKKEIVENTFYNIFRAYHNGNCPLETCTLASLEAFEKYNISTLIELHLDQKINWGQLWFMVDTNQALMFLPKHSPKILKTPQIVLNKVIRSTKRICRFFRFASNNSYLEEDFPRSSKDPPIFWANRGTNVTETVSEVLVDLCATKGVKPPDICVIPFLQNEKLSKDAINMQIYRKFVENAFRPVGVSDVESFLNRRAPNEFLVAWALRVKGLEFKVVVMVVDEDQFDQQDADDRRKLYVIASRSTCMLVVIGDESFKNSLELKDCFQDYCFNIEFEYQKALSDT
ncbi:uncharacterized protein LOC115883624 isoform X2 [Sitophilus oryzae]|nr:uncharacterized protein LOC115883624 isoform X2 [Sitophilus oryzae]XP_030757842.1 uncharacterized protein LOC115883624 isoform X2 [Sitophilus oryzae]